MDLNPIDRRRILEEEVYDEFPSTDTSNETDCNRERSNGVGTHDVTCTFTRKLKRRLSIDFDVDYLLLLMSYTHRKRYYRTRK